MAVLGFHKENAVNTVRQNPILVLCCPRVTIPAFSRCMATVSVHDLACDSLEFTATSWHPWLENGGVILNIHTGKKLE